MVCRYAWVLAGQHMLVWGARSCTLSLSLSLSRLLRKSSLCTLPEVLLPGLPRDPRAGSGVKLDPGSLAVVPVKDFPRHSCCTVACLKSVTQIVHALCPAVIVVPTPSAFNSKCLQPDNACIMLYLSLSLPLSLSLSLSVTCQGPGHTPAMMWGGSFPTPDEPPPHTPQPE